MIIAVILWLILAVSVMGIGVLMFPVLKTSDEALALGYAGIRLIETVFIIAASISLLAIVTLSQDYSAGASDATSYQPAGAVLVALHDWSFVIGTLIFLGLGGLCLNYLLYQLRLVPRWLSVWGLIGAALVLLYGLISLFGPDPGFLAVLIAVQEMVFAVWLIVKGFSPSGIAFGSAKPATN
jgi:hypothetical protein